MHSTTEFPARIINSYTGELPKWWGEPVAALGARASIVQDAFVTASSIVGWPRGVASRIETSAGESVPDSEFWRISQISTTPTDIDTQRSQARRLSGEYTYLGWLIGHYGHFITESISRLWYCLDPSTPRRFLVHTNYRSFAELPAHVVTALAAFGIDGGNLTLAREPFRVDRLHCPAPALRCDDSSGRHMAGVYRHIVNSFTAPATPTRKVFVSRRSLPGDTRQYNEADLQTVFAGLGFETIAPESLGFEEQIRIYADATHIAGPVGSGLHNAVFMPQGGRALIVAPNHFMFRNDCLLSAAAGYQLDYFIADNGGSADISQKPWHVDVDAVVDSVTAWAE